MYYLDTCVCVAFLRGEMPGVQRLMQESDPSLFGIPSIVVGELEAGVEKSVRRRENRLLLERFLRPFAIVPFDEASAREYGRLRTKLEGRRLAIGPNDMLVASMAIAHQAVLVTRNVRVATRIDGLRVEDWDEVEL